MDLNLKTSFLMMPPFLPFLRVGSSPGTPSKVINIASIDGCGKLNALYNYAYGAGKASTIQLSRYMGGGQPRRGGDPDQHQLVHGDGEDTTLILIDTYTNQVGFCSTLETTS